MSSSMQQPAATWTTRGFDAFRRGTFGNAGHNLYVSRAGILQRIHQYDLNQDGWVDLLFSNSQDHWENPPSYAYRWTGTQFARTEVPADGATGGAVADLNKDGIPELIFAPWYDGIGFDINAMIFYGPGWSEQAVHYIPANLSFSVVAGDFNGDGKTDLAFQCRDHLRLFLQTELTFEPKKYVDLPIKASRIAAADLDGDGCCDLVARFADQQVRIYWGGDGGINPERFTVLRVPGEADAGDSATKDSPAAAPYVEWVEDALPLPRIVNINDKKYVFVTRENAAWFFPVEGRSVGLPMRIDCPRATSVSSADLDGDGFDDLVFACRDNSTGSESSWIYWGTARGFSNEARTPLATDRACDVAVGRFDGRGQCIAIAQRFKGKDFSVPARVFRLHGRKPELWQTLESHDPTQILTIPSKDDTDQILLVNSQGRNKHGSVPATIYFGGPSGFSPDRQTQLDAWGCCVSVCADFNDDGIPDIALANASENSVDLDPGSYIHLNSPAGFGGKPAQIVPTKHAHGIACADLDRDGYLDLVFVGFDNDDIRIFRGGPNGFDTENPIRIRMQLGDVIYKEPRFITLADLNNDGWLDLIIPLVGSDHSLILWGGPEGFSMARHTRLNTWHCCSCRAADLDGDGYLDLIMGGHTASGTGPHDSFAYIYWNGPDGLREDRRTLLPSEAVNSISVADFNNDGNLDLFVGSYQDGRKRRDIDSYIYWNRGGRQFSAKDFTRLFNHSASGDFVADFNEDGWIDIAIANHKKYGDHKAHSKVWWNGPGGFDEKNVTCLPTEGPHGMVSPGAGNIMDRSAEEHYISEPHQMPAGSTVSKVEWDADLGPKTWVKASVRFASSAEQLNQANWIAADSLGGNSPRDGWMQYRLSLGATNSGSTPRVREVRVHFRKI